MSNKTQSRQPSAAIIESVGAAFDPNELKFICETDDFSDYATRVELPGTDRFYWYQDNGADILAVAHLDTVQEDRTCTIIDTNAGPLVTSGGLDDRLGAYVILDLLPALGVTVDWLLTTDEEVCASTASDFAASYIGKQYNWTIEFDRGGTDVVMYQYETPEYVDLIKEAGAQVGHGSYSDIADLASLGCVGFNWGVGYQDYHSPRAHAWLSDTFKMVARFMNFYAANSHTHLPHTPSQYENETRWWMQQDEDSIMIEADCGHDVDLADPTDYMEWATDYIICMDCANDKYEADYLTADTDSEAWHDR